MTLTVEQIEEKYHDYLQLEFNDAFDGASITKAQFLTIFHEHAQLVYMKADEVDEEEEQDWYSIALGFALAKGLTPAQSHEYALIERYRVSGYLLRPESEDE